MIVDRLDFRFSEYYNEREVEQLLEELTSRGASYGVVEGPNYHLDIPQNLDFTPFYQTLRDCESVAWVAAKTRIVVILKDIGIEG